MSTYRIAPWELLLGVAVGIFLAWFLAYVVLA